MANGNFTYIVVVNDSPDLKLGFSVYYNNAMVKERGFGIIVIMGIMSVMIMMNIV